MCRGRRPCLGPEGDEENCEEHLSLLVRTASKAYFSQCVSALSVPDKTGELLDRVSQATVWSIMQAATPENIVHFRTVPAVKAALEAGARRLSDLPAWLSTAFAPIVGLAVG